jgi:hypothetical protein
MSLGDEQKPKQKTPSGSNNSNPQAGANSGGLTKADIEAAINALDAEKRKLAQDVEREKTKVAAETKKDQEERQQTINDEAEKSKSEEEKISKEATTDIEKDTTEKGEISENQSPQKSVASQETVTQIKQVSQGQQSENQSVENQAEEGQPAQSNPQKAGAASSDAVNKGPDYADYLPTGDPIVDSENQASVARLRQQDAQRKEDREKEKTEKEQDRIQEKEDQGKQKVSDKLWADYMEGKRETAPTQDDVNEQFSKNEAEKEARKNQIEGNTENTNQPDVGDGLAQSNGYGNTSVENQTPEGSTTNTAPEEGNNSFMPTATPGTGGEAPKAGDGSSDYMNYAPTGNPVVDAANQAQVDRMREQRAEDEKNAAKDKEEKADSKVEDQQWKDYEDGKRDTAPTKDSIADQKNTDKEKNNITSQNPGDGNTKEVSKSNPNQTVDSNNESEAFKNKSDDLKNKVEQKGDSKKDAPAGEGAKPVGKPKLGARLSTANDKLNAAKNIAQDPGGAAKQAAEQKIKEMAQKAAKEAAKKAAQMAARAAQAAGSAVSTAVSAIGAALAPALPFIIGVIIAVVLFIAVFAVIMVDAYCTPRPFTRGIIEYALTGDAKNLIQAADGVPVAGGAAAKVGDAIATHSDLYKKVFYGDGGICPDKNPDKCPPGSGTSGGGSTSGSYGTATGKVTAAECAKLKEYKAFIEEAASAYSWPAPFIGAILSQETEVGLGGGINPKGCEGRGDVGGRGHGLGQVDQASGAFGKYYTDVDRDGKLLHPQPKQFPVGEKLVTSDGTPLTDKAGKQLTWSDCRDNIMFVAYHLDEVRRYCKNDLKSKGAEGSATFLKSVADGYNKWCGGVRDDKITAERDGLRYGASVINRAADVAKCFSTAKLDNEVDQILDQLAQKPKDGNIPLKNAITKQVETRLADKNTDYTNTDDSNNETNGNIFSKFLGGVDVEAFNTTGPVLDPEKDNIKSEPLKAAFNSGTLLIAEGTGILPKPKFLEDIEGGLDPLTVKFLLDYVIPGGITITALSTQTHRYLVGDKPGGNITDHSYAKAVDLNLQNAADATKIKTAIDAAEAGGMTFKQFGADSSKQALMVAAGFTKTMFDDGPGHLHVAFAGGNSTTTGAVNPSTNNGGCIRPCGSVNGSGDLATQNNTNITNSDADQKYMATAASQAKWSKMSSPLITIIHYTASGTASFDSISGLFKEAIEKGPGNSGDQGWAHYMIDRDGKSAQFMTEDRKVSGASGLTGFYYKDGQKLVTNDHAVQYEVHYDAGAPYNETISDAQLKTLAKTVVKSGFKPNQIYTHWGVQPYDRSDSKDWIPTNGTIPTKLIQFVKYAGWASDDAGAKTIAKGIIKQNLENAIKVQETLMGKDSKGATISSNENNLSSLQAGLSALNAISFGDNFEKLDNTQQADSGTKARANDILKGLVNGVEVRAADASEQAIRERVAGYFRDGEFGQLPGGASDIDGVLFKDGQGYEINIVKFLDNAYKAGLAVYTGPSSYGRTYQNTNHKPVSAALDVWGVGLLSDIKGKGKIKGMKTGASGGNWAGGFPDTPANNGNTPDPRIRRHVDTPVDSVARDLFEKLYDVGFASGKGLQFITRPELLDQLKSKNKTSSGAKPIETDKDLAARGGTSFLVGGVGAHFHHFHFNFTSGDFKDYTGGLASAPCGGDCKQTGSVSTVSDTLAKSDNEITNILKYISFNPLGSIEAYAAFGSKPSSYDTIKNDAKYMAFLKEIADTRGYEQYRDAGGKNSEMETALAAMVAASDGKLRINNTYRSYEDQVVTYFASTGVTSPISKYWSASLNPAELTAVKAAYLARGTVSAPPGYSQHSTGLAVDFREVENSFEGTAGYTFLKASAETFGFKESYPKGTNKGAGFEPWHWQFVGNAKYKLSTPLTSFQIGAASGGSSSPCTPVVADPAGTIDLTTPLDPTVTYDE